MSVDRQGFRARVASRPGARLLTTLLVLALVAAWGREAEAQVNALAGRVTSDVQNTSTSFADVTGLSWYVAANANYAFACRLSYTTAGGAGFTPANLALSVSGPTSPTALRYKVMTATGSTTVASAMQTAYDTATDPGGTGGSTEEPVVIQGLIENGNTAGTFTIRFARIGGFFSPSATILRDSFCTVSR